MSDPNANADLASPSLEVRAAVMSGPPTKSYHCCPSHCVDDICVHSDQGLCGAYRCDDPLDGNYDEVDFEEWEGE